MVVFFKDFKESSCYFFDVSLAFFAELIIIVSPIACTAWFAMRL
jgi:hypothetical protein